MKLVLRRDSERSSLVWVELADTTARVDPIKKGFPKLYRTDQSVMFEILQASAEFWSLLSEPTISLRSTRLKSHRRHYVQGPYTCQSIAGLVLVGSPVAQTGCVE